jgi:hypothetical protein
MKTFRAFVWSLNWVVAVTCGFVGIMWFLDNEVYFLPLASEYPGWGLVLFLVAVITVVLNISYVVVRHVQGYAMRTHIPVKGPDGSITVSLDALQKALVRALSDQPEVHSVELELTHDPKKRAVTRVRAIGTIWEGPDALQTTVKMQNVLRRRFLEIVEPEEEPEFEVRLDRFRYVRTRRKFRERVDRIKETFRGPQYPIGGG